MRDTVLTALVVVLMVFGVTAGIAMAKPMTDRLGFPDGYVGGTLLPNGDVMGGHPSEEVMEKNRIAAGYYDVNKDAFMRMMHGNYEVP